MLRLQIQVKEAYMSYTSNKRKKIRKQTKEDWKYLVAQTFEDFCKQRNITDYNMLPTDSDRYKQLWAEWESYREMYSQASVRIV